MKAFILENIKWVLPLCGSGVMTAWTLYQWRVKRAEQRTAQVQKEIDKEHRITGMEGDIKNHDGQFVIHEKRISSLEERSR